jgi:hypothetical protein
MAVITARPTLTTTAVKLWTDVTGEPPDATFQVTVQNGATNTICLGNSATTTSVYGYLLAVNGVITFTLRRGEELWGCASASTQQVNVLVAGF